MRTVRGTGITIRNEIPDDRLRLIFTCCHPALALEAQVALTLRTLGGLETDEIARAFLVPGDDHGAATGPSEAQDSRRGHSLQRTRHERNAGPVDAVLTAIYLVFNEGYASTRGEPLMRVDLCAEALRLGDIVSILMAPPSAEATGLVALMLLHDSRRDARVDEAGDLVVLEEQDRRRWNQQQIAEALPLVEECATAAQCPVRLHCKRR